MIDKVVQLYRYVFLPPPCTMQVFINNIFSRYTQTSVRPHQKHVKLCSISPASHQFVLASCFQMWYLLITERNFLRRKDKEDWLEVIKKKILEQVGRDNTTNKTTPKIERENIPVFNFSEIIPKFLNNNTLPDDQIAEEIRSYYPSCKFCSISTYNSINAATT